MLNTSLENRILITKMDNSEANIKLLSDFLSVIDTSFPVPLSQKVNISDYSPKVFNLGIVFQAMIDGEMVGVLIGYANDYQNFQGYISLFGILEEYRGMGIGKKLLQAMLDICRSRGMKELALDVHKQNEAAQKFYQKNGFTIDLNLPAKYEYSIRMKRDVESMKCPG